MRAEAAEHVQQKRMSLRMSINAHENAAALLAFRHAEDKMNTLAAENHSLSVENEVRFSKDQPDTVC